MSADADFLLGYGVGASNWTMRRHFQLLLGFVLGFFIALVSLLLYDRFLLQAEHLKQHTTATQHWQTGYMTALHEVATETSTLQERLNTEVRVLCMVLTTPEHHASRAAHVRATWGKRCNKMIFWSSERDEELGAVAVVEPEADIYDNLWNKTREGMRYAYETLYEDYDWFLKADDDTYVIMENLRYMLYGYEPETPIYFGYKLVRYDVPYMSGGAAYVLSKAALKRFMHSAFHNTTLCPKPHTYGIEDFYMGICLQNVGVHLADARFALPSMDKKPKFLPLDLRQYLDPIFNDTIPDWLIQMTPYPIEKGFNCCSNYSIAFHYTPPEHMYLYEFLIYHLRVFGFKQDPMRLPKKMSLATVRKRFSSNYTESGTPLVNISALNLLHYV